MKPPYVVAILVLLALVVPASPAHAGGIVSICDETHLLAALAGGGTVTFACSGTITLTDTIPVAADMTIDGSGQTVTISGNSAVRTVYVNSGVTLNLNYLTIANSADSGIYNHGGIVTVSHSTFSDNRASGGGGGGIYNNNGTLIVSHSTFVRNRTDGGGGGIFNDDDGRLTVSNSSFSGNSASSGGGIANDTASTLTVSNSTFTGNSASTSGGGIYNDNDSTLNVHDSTPFWQQRWRLWRRHPQRKR